MVNKANTLNKFLINNRYKNLNYIYIKEINKISIFTLFSSFFHIIGVLGFWGFGVLGPVGGELLKLSLKYLHSFSCGRQSHTWSTLAGSCSPHRTSTLPGWQKIRSGNGSRCVCTLYPPSGPSLYACNTRKIGQATAGPCVGGEHTHENRSELSAEHRPTV